MRRWRRVGGVAALAAALPLSGCGALFGGYDTAPNGLPRAEAELRQELAHRPVDAYVALIDGQVTLPDDDLLRLLYAGTAGRYAGAWDEGAHLLDVASYLAEDRATLSVSRQALSLVTSDRALAYEPSAIERLMIPYVAAATYVEAGDLQAAGVEARRMEALLDRLDDRARPGRAVDASGPAPDPTPADGVDRPFFHSLAGALFEAAGDRAAAEVAYRRAGLDEDGAYREAWDAGQDSVGEVVVLVESGYVPHRVEQSVVILIPPWQLELLTDGSAGEKAIAAAEAAARVLLTAAHLYGDRSGYYHDRGYRRSVRLEPWELGGCGDWDGAECEDVDRPPYLLRISWPVLFQESAPAIPARVRAGELGADPEARLDVARAVRSDFETDRSAMLARTLVRAASKVALSSAAQGAVEKKDAAAGQIVGLLTNLGTLLTERADTRSWHLLPGSVSLVRLRLPAGRHDLRLELDHDRAGGRSVELGTVDVRAGRTVLLTHRVWR